MPHKMQDAARAVGNQVANALQRRWRGPFQRHRQRHLPNGLLQAQPFRLDRQRLKSITERIGGNGNQV